MLYLVFSWPRNSIPICEKLLTNSIRHPVHFVSAIAIVTEMGWDASSIRTCDVNSELLEVGSWRVDEELCVAVVGNQAKPLP